MKNLLIFALLLFSVEAYTQYKTLYDFTATAIDGTTFDFSTLKGKKVMIVNTASECTLTPQFKKLERLYEKYGGNDFEIIGFPSNDFGGQEPASDSVIYEFCTQKYNITFPMMSKISIKGDDAHPIYKWLTSSKENGTLDAKVTWNFQKFLIDENGHVVAVVHPIQSAQSKRVIDWLKGKKK